MSNAPPGLRESYDKYRSVFKSNGTSDSRSLARLRFAVPGFDEKCPFIGGARDECPIRKDVGIMDRNVRDDEVSDQQLLEHIRSDVSCWMNCPVVPPVRPAWSIAGRMSSVSIRSKSIPSLVPKGRTIKTLNICVALSIYFAEMVRGVV
jgi:hypothetical protein